MRRDECEELTRMDSVLIRASDSLESYRQKIDFQGKIWFLPAEKESRPIEVTDRNFLKLRDRSGEFYIDE